MRFGSRFASKGETQSKKKNKTPTAALSQGGRNWHAVMYTLVILPAALLGQET